MASVLTQSDLLASGGDVIYLLTVTFAGRDWRWASRRIEVTDADGLARLYQGGLEGIDFADELEIGSGDVPSPRSASFALAWPEIPELVEQGHDLASATAELSAYIAGTSYEDRLVLLSGIVPEPEYGDASEGVALSIEERPFDAPAVIVEAEARIFAQTWPDRADEYDGEAYPLVFGQGAGQYTQADGTSSRAGATPCYIVDESTYFLLLIAGHPTQAGYDGASVDINRAESLEWVTKTAEHHVDGNGRLVTVVPIGTEMGRGTDPWVGGDTFACAWGTSSGIGRTDNAGYVTTAGDLLVLMLSKASAKVDWGATFAAKSRFDELLVGGYADDGDPLDWIADNILPLFPDACLTSGPGGIYPWIDRPITTLSVVADIIEGEQGITRSSTVSYVGRDAVANLLTLSYAYGLQRGAYQRSRTLTGNPAREDIAGDVLLSLDARKSRVKYGDRALAIESDILYSTSAADAVLSKVASVRSKPRRVVSYEADFMWAWLRKGDAVRLTDSRLSINERFARIKAIRWSDAGVGIDLVLAD